MKLNQGNAIPLSHARLLVRRAVDKASELKQHGVFIVIAVTAVNFKCASSDTEKLVRNNPALSRLSEIIPFKFLPFPGGVPIRDGNIIAGAIGVSGGSPHVNEQIAEAAIEAVNRQYHS